MIKISIIGFGLRTAPIGPVPELRLLFLHRGRTGARHTAANLRLVTRPGAWRSTCQAAGAAAAMTANLLRGSSHGKANSLVLTKSMASAKDVSAFANSRALSAVSVTASGWIFALICTLPVSIVTRASSPDLD